MTKSIKPQILAFLEGFYQFVPYALVSLFNEYELVSGKKIGTTMTYVMILMLNKTVCVIEIADNFGTHGVWKVFAWSITYYNMNHLKEKTKLLL